MKINDRLLSYIRALVLITVWLLMNCSLSFSQDDLEKLKDKYFSEKNYSEFIDYLQNLKKENPKDLEINYYLALSRYTQLKDLEEKKDWDRYFSLRNIYRDKIIKETENVIDKAKDLKIVLEAKYLRWLIHRDFNDEEKDLLLKELINLAFEYTQKERDFLILKKIAKRLETENEEPASLSFYNLYAKALIESNISLEQLRQEADDLYEEDNIRLSSKIYEHYIERLIKESNFSRQDLSSILISIVKKFSDSGQKDVKDLEFAEKSFLRLKELGELTEELQYLRAYNLQRKKEYLRCVEEYQILLKNYPQTKYSDEVKFKLGIIYLYELKDIQKAKDILRDLSEQGFKKEYTLSSLYHLGLYYQYKEEKEKANDFYQKILDLAEDGKKFSEIVKSTQKRLREIKESRPIEYNLKIFLDSVFLEKIIAKNLEFSGLPGKGFKEEEINFQVKFLPSETGCLVPEFKFLWSGDLGGLEEITDTHEFVASYSNLGTKVINLVVILHSQILDSSIEMIDIYEENY